jgi:cytochrome P450
MGFGEGGRRCVGERLAMTEMKVFLSTLARRVDFDLVRSNDEVLWNKNAFMSRPIDGTEIIPCAVVEAVKLEA